MLTEIGSVKNVPRFIKTRQEAGERKMMGFGHRIYKSYDPRAKIVKRLAYEVFEVTGRNPLIDIALELERIAPRGRILRLASSSILTSISTPGSSTRRWVSR